MSANDPFRRPTFGPAVIYKDPRAAVVWLEMVFSFKPAMLITDQDGNLVHAEMRFGDGTIMLGSEWSDFVASPASTAGKNTQMVHVHLNDSIDEHYERAKAGGATILQGPEDQFWGDRTYRARDLEGHVWTFGQTVRRISREEAEQATGLKIEGWH